MSSHSTPAPTDLDSLLLHVEIPETFGMRLEHRMLVPYWSETRLLVKELVSLADSGQLTRTAIREKLAMVPDRKGHVQQRIEILQTLANNCPGDFRQALSQK